MLTVLAACGVVFGVLGLIAGALALRTLGRLRRSVGLLGRGAGSRRESFLEATGRHVASSEATRREFDELNLGVLRALEGLQRQLNDEVGNRHGALASLHGALGHDIEGVRTEVGASVEQTRAGLDTELAAIKDVVNRELAELRERYDGSREAAFDQIEAERQTLVTAAAQSQRQLDAAVDRVEAAVDGSLRRVALVRFDAFDDLSGRLSFCLALLDGRGDGIAVTSLAGRTENRLYAKPIEAGASATELSPEERQAVRAALQA